MTALCAVAIAQTAGGAIFKCQDAQGKVTYQQKPCEGATATGPSAPALTDTKGAPPTSTDQKAEKAVLTLLVQKYQCDLGHPEIDRQTKANYERWRERNAKEIAKVEASAEYRESLGEAKVRNPAVTPAMLNKVCQSVAQQLDQEARAAEPRRQPTAR
jgi:hypothetical protein